MTPSLNPEAARVWHATRPALRRRRVIRRAALGTTLALVLTAGIFLALFPIRPDVPPLAAHDHAAPERPNHSLAILVMDATGARFAQLSPEELAGEGLTFELTLDPVVTNTTGLYLY